MHIPHAFFLLPASRSELLYSDFHIWTYYFHILPILQHMWWCPNIIISIRIWTLLLDLRLPLDLFHPSPVPLLFIPFVAFFPFLLQSTYLFSGFPYSPFLSYILRRSRSHFSFYFPDYAQLFLFCFIQNYFIYWCLSYLRISDSYRNIPQQRVFKQHIYYFVFPFNF